MNRSTIEIEFNDMKNLILWDYKTSTMETKKSHPDGKTTLFYLERFFTSSKLTKYKSELHFANSELSKQILPEIEKLLDKTLKKYQQQEQLLVKQVKNLPFTDVINDTTRGHKNRVTIELLPCHLSLSFIRINQLCDSCILSLKKIHLCGGMTTSEYYKTRKEVLKDLISLISGIKRFVNEVNKTLDSITMEKKVSLAK